MIGKRLGLVVIGCSLALGGCSQKISGPTPTVSAVSPAAVCQVQLDTDVQVTGDGLSPLYTSALANGRLELPAITLTRAVDIAGAVALGNAVAIPDDPTTMTGDVRWVSQTQMSFKIRPQLGLQPGLYDLALANPNGNSAGFPQSLLAVPPPRIMGMTMGLGPDLLCGDKQNVLTITGDFFIKSAQAAPTVIFTDGMATARTLPAVPVQATCRPLPGNAGLEACTSVTVDIPAGNLPNGNHKVVVKNPDPVGCSSTTDETGAAVADKVLTIVPQPTVTTVAPEALCVADAAVSVTITGAGFLTVNGAGPTVMLGDGLSLPGTPSQCSPVMGPEETVTTCTTLTISVPMATAANSYELRVMNPAPADCVSAPPNKRLTLFDRPVIDKVQPPSLCTLSGEADVVITGSNFVTYAGLPPAVKVADKAYTATAGGCMDVGGPVMPTQICTSLTIKVTPSELPTGVNPVQVTNPTPIGCANMPSATATLEINTPPVLTAVAPSSVCAGSAVLTLTGSNFSMNATVKLADAVARVVTVTDNGTKAVAEFAGGLTAGGPYDVTIENGPGCAASRAMAVSVVDGPQIFFADPEIVWNGLNIQATIYGTGFSGAVQAVALKKMGSNDIPLTFMPVVNRANQVQVTIPASTAPGVYTVELRDETSCPALLPDALTVTDQKTLMLAMPAVTPPFGWKSGSTAITIAGANVAMNDFKAVPRVYINPQSPGAGTIATALGAVSFVDARELTALVPSGLPAGQYDVIVVNPDGKVGVAEGGFEVADDPPPTIETLSPGTVANTNPQTFNILGRNFRMPAVTLSCVDGAGNALATSPAATVAAATPTNIEVSFNASAAGVACVVRVTNGDNATYGDFSALVITNPAQNLNPAKAGNELLIGRRAPVALGGDASNAARFLHVLGGDDGAGVATDTVETAALDLLGVPGSFYAQPNKLTVARAFAGGVRLGRFLYVAGGSNGTTRHDTVDRAVVLDPEQRGQITDLLFQVNDAGLGAGVRYYRVAAVMKADDPFNPGGENLPSDPFPVRVPDLGNRKLHITVVWAADPNAQSYRIYRSPNPGDPVSALQLIGEVAAPATSFTDTGVAPTQMVAPLPVGALGRWHALSTKLTVAREGAGVALGMDPADATRAYLYVVGGRSDATSALDSYEFLPITLNPDGSQTAGTFAVGATKLGLARWQVGASAATAQLSPNVPAGQTFIYAIGGVGANGMASKDAEAAPVQAGGELGAFVKVAGNAGTGGSVAGAPTIAAANLVFVFGGANASPSEAVSSAELCGGANNKCQGMNTTPPYVVNFNAGQTMLTARYLAGGTLSGAFIYVAGGVGMGNAVLKQVEYRLW